MALVSYYDFAENDYAYFMASMKHGLISNAMGSIAQGICEKYMKHVIAVCYEPDSVKANAEKTEILRTHSLNRLMKFLKKNLDITFTPDTIAEMRMIDGFYFSTRYPGEESLEIDEEDLAHCQSAITGCRDEVSAFLVARA